MINKNDVFLYIEGAAKSITSNVEEAMKLYKGFENQLNQYYQHNASLQARPAKPDNDIDFESKYRP